MAEIEQRIPLATVLASRIRQLFQSRLLRSVGLGFGLSFLVGGALIAWVGVNPIEALRVAFDGALATRRGLGDTLAFATPRLLVGLGAGVASRSGVFNLGGEGQLDRWGQLVPLWSACL